MEVEILSLITGPLGALALSVGIIVWMAKFMLPVLQNYLDKQSNHLGDLIAALNRTVSAHEHDRKVFSGAINTLSIRIEKVEDVVENISVRLDKVSLKQN
jgi:hypothetical protein